MNGSSVLNYKGRWEYVCESGIQVIGSIYLYKKGKKLVRFSSKKFRQLVGRRKPQKAPLTMAQKYNQRKNLQSLLTNDGVYISNLTPYQRSLLKPKDMKKMRASSLTDEIANSLSNRHLRAISLENIRDISVANNGRTLSRLSDDQFRAVMGSGQNISQLPFEAIEGNIKRIRGADIGKLDQLDQISPKVFGQMSAGQIRGMSHRQVNNVTPEQEGALSNRLKAALTETRQKRQREEDAKTPEEKQREQAERQQKQEEWQRGWAEEHRRQAQQRQANLVRLQEERIRNSVAVSDYLRSFEKTAKKEIKRMNSRVDRLEKKAKKLDSHTKSYREKHLPKVEAEIAHLRRRLASEQDLQNWRSDLLVKTNLKQQLDDLDIPRQQKESRRQQLDEEIADLNKRVTLEQNTRKWEDELLASTTIQDRIKTLNSRVDKLEERAKKLNDFHTKSYREKYLPKVEAEIAHLRRRLASEQDFRSWRSDLVMKARQKQQLDDLDIPRQQKESRRRQLDKEIADLDKRLTSEQNIRKWENIIIGKIRDKELFDSHSAKQKLDEEIEVLNRRIRDEKRNIESP